MAYITNNLKIIVIIISAIHLEMVFMGSSIYML